MKKVAIICAIPQESRPILSRLHNPVKGRLHNMPVWTSQSPELQVFLAQSGIGTARAAAAARELISFAAPDLVISTGFCGALKPGLQRGDLVVAEKLFTCSTALRPFEVTLDRRFWELIGESGFQPGTFITTEKMEAKSRIAPLVDAGCRNPVLEMESSAVASVCKSCDTPFVAIRAVSDTADQDPQPICARLFNAEMKISVIQTVKALLATPQMTRQLLQLYVDAGAAGKSLGKAIEYTVGRLL